MAEEPTYPNEVFPSDVTVLALDGTLDAETGLPYVAKGVGPTNSPTYEVQYNRRLLRQNKMLAVVRQGMAVDEGSLRIGVYPITYRLGGATKTFSGATDQSVPDDATRAVYLDNVNTLQVQASFPQDVTRYLPLATVTAVAGSLTIIDERSPVMWQAPLVDVSANTVPFAPSVHLAGVMSVKVWEIEWVAPVAFTLRSATGRVSTAPVGASLIVDVRVGGTSVFAQQPDMIVIASGSQQDTSATVDHAVSVGDVLTFEVEQVGLSTAGSDLTIVLNGLAAVQLG